MSVVPNSPKAWFLAARPKTLSAALAPVLIAAALAHSEGHFALLPVALCLAFAALMQIAANFINDLFDFLRGTDGAERLGPERACAQGWISPQAMRRGIAVAIALASCAGLSLLHFGGVELVLIGVACIVFAFLYTTLLSYCGLGDLLVWVFFGFVPVCGTYFVLAGEVSGACWWAAAASGLVTDTLLVLNNYRDRETDASSGKRTIIVIFGERFGRYFYLFQGVAAYACFAATAAYGHTWATLLPMLYLPAHVATWRTMVSIFRGRELNRVLGLTSRNILLFALLCVAALLCG